MRITLEECEKYTSPFIEEEINRLKDKGEITTAEEELQQRINLGYYEDNVKDVEKISNKDEFWNSISVHGLENQSLLRDELNKGRLTTSCWSCSRDGRGYRIGYR